MQHMAVLENASESPSLGNCYNRGVLVMSSLEYWSYMVVMLSMSRMFPVVAYLKSFGDWDNFSVSMEGNNHPPKVYLLSTITDRRDSVSAGQHFIFTMCTTSEPTLGQLARH